MQSSIIAKLTHLYYLKLSPEEVELILSLAQIQLMI